MKRIFALMATLALCLTAAASQAQETKLEDPAKAAEVLKTDSQKVAEILHSRDNSRKAAEVLKTDSQKVAYSIGMQVGDSLEVIKDHVDLDALILGLKDSFSGKKPLLTPEEAESVMEAFSEKIQEEMRVKQNEKADINRKSGEEFLAENKKKEGVKVTDSGLQYKVVREGTGDTPKATDRVKVHYRGTLIDGTEFDSSYKRGQPTTFPVGAVIRGWTEALQLMKVGSKYELTIPSDLAYGAQGPGEIGPNSVLQFEVELIEIEKTEDAKK